MNETIFTKIINREIPADIVYEDEQFLAFLDIHPVKKGHVLLITKTPYEWLGEVPDEILTAVTIKAKELANSMKHLLGCERVLTIIEGREVPHFHIHLIPIMLDDKVADWHHESYEGEEEKEYARRISQAL